MQELLLAVARGLVEDKEAVKVTVDEPREDGTIVYHLSVAEGDMGRVIGKQGRSQCTKERVIPGIRPHELIPQQAGQRLLGRSIQGIAAIQHLP